MAKYYLSDDGSISKKKKEKEKEINNKGNRYILQDDGSLKLDTRIKKEEEEKDTWFKSGAYKDGYQFGDLTKTTLSTVGDVGVNLVKGAGGLVEGVGDLATYGIADAVGLFGNETKANQMRENAKKNTVDELFQPLESAVDKNSVLGNKSDNIVEGLGYVAAITGVSLLTGGAGAALGASAGTAATVGTTATTFISAMGNNMSQALNEGATLEEARIYGAIAGAAEAGSELLFGGLGKVSKAVGLSTGALDDVLVGGLTKNIKNKLAKTVLQAGLKAGGEGFEELVSGFISAIGKKATYMKDEDFGKILSDEKLGEQFFMGALTSAIAQGPSTIRSVKNGTDTITGRTDNEQKVYDNEVNARKEAKIKEATIEKAYNEQIKAQENLGVKLTEEAKADIMKKVESAYDSGSLEAVGLNKKDLIKIEEQVDIDMQEGNISIDNIRGILGENIDVKKDSMLMRSVYENEQKYKDFEYEKTDNEKVNVLMQSAKDSGMNNTRKTRKKVELIAKLTKDTDRQYKFVSPEQLKQMGYREDANGLIDKSTGEILINAHSDKGIQSIVGHETTHIFDSKVKGKGQHSIAQYSKEYQALQDAAIEYAKAKGIYDSKVQSITNAYGNLLTNESQIKEELTADLVGDFLFNDEAFIENLAVKNRNIFERIYDYIKHTYKMMKGTDEEKAFENLKNKFEKVYKIVGKTNNQVAEKGARYSIGGEKAIENIKNTKYYEKAYSKLELAKSLKNKSNAELIEKTGWYKDQAGDWKFEFSDNDMELKKTNYAINKEYSLEDILEHDVLFYFYPELAGYNVVFKNKRDSGFTRGNNTITISASKIGNDVELKGTIIHEVQHAIQNIENYAHGADINKGLMRYLNTLGEIEAADTKQRYLNEFEGKKNTKLPETAKRNSTHPDVKDGNVLIKIANGIYNYFHQGEKNINKNKNNTNPTSNPDIRYSLTDNNGKKLSKEQQEYFKDSKVRDDDGNLLVMYHGSESKFNEFNSSINWFTDSEEYSNYYGRKENTIQKALGLEAKKSKNTYKTYLDIKNPKVLGNIDGYINQDFDVEEFIEASDISREDFNKLLEKYNEGKPEYEKAYRIYELTNSEAFKNYLISQGYDGIKANEKGHTSYGVFNSNQIKNIDNTSPTTKPDIRYSLSEDNKGRKLSENQKEYYKDISPELKDENGNLKTYYHGTQRADRVGTIFDPNKATSGPMAFFTDNQDVAKNYSENKSDTSLSREYDTEYDLFKVNGMDLDTYWNSLSAKERIKIKEQANNVGFDEDWENVIYEERASENSFSNEYKWRLNNKYKGNALKSLYSVWIEDGNIMFEDLVKFKQVLELAGVKDVEYLDPYKIDAKVYETYLNIKNPFNTSNISEDVLNQFREASKTAKIGEQYSADMWDKSNISPENWIAKLENDIENGTTHSWTVIPDWVTNVLKANGYDGIVDTGGKGGGVGHQVVIPFYSNQIKSVDNLNPTENPDINLSLTNDVPITGDDIAVRDMLKQERATIEEEVGKTPGAETLTVEDVINQTPEEKEQGMKEKAKKYLSRSKTRFIEKIVDDFGTSKIANTKVLSSVVDSIREDIQKNGPLTKEKADSYFNELYNNLVTTDTLYYDTYKDVKDNIRATKLYISDEIKSDIADYNSFRQRNMGTLVMTNDSNNVSVDSYYQEMSDLYPELFPTDIINPTDQLERIAEVAKDITKVERNVAAYNDIYEGPDYRDWARAEFDKNINSFMNDIKLAERYNSATNEAPKIGVDKEIVKNTYKQLPEAKKVYERALAKELLTKEDRVQVDRLLNNEIDISQIPDGLNRKGIIAVATAKQEYDILQKVIKEYQDDIRHKRLELVEEDIGDLNLWKDKKTGFKYSRETAIRNIYDVAPEEVADNVVRKYFRSYIEVNEKKVTDAINGYNDRIKNLDIGTKNKYEITFEGETKKVSESALIQLLGEKKITVDAIKKSGANVAKIERAVKEFRNIYNELIAQINESMLDNGYAPVEYRKDYFPHFTEETTDTMLGKAAKLLGINITNREELPTDIAGQTYKFKPGRTWFSSILQRTTDATDYDALKGFDKYVRGATDLIYHTGDIQNLRALSTVIRGTYNDTELQNRITEINESTMSDLEKSEAIQDVYDKAKDKSHLSKFVEWLDNYTNLLAGKKAINDRGLEKELNRQMYKTMQDIESRIAANAIGGNIGVSLTNFTPIAQAWGEVKTTNLINGIWQTMKASVGKDNSFASESQFITRRRGTDTLSETTLEKVTKPINKVLEFADRFASETIVRARYNQNLQEGMSPELALEEADRYTAGLMADRGRGALPTQFSNKNPISKMINMFQVEVNNQWSYYTKDLPKHMREKANTNKTKIVADTAMAYTKIMVGAYLTNELLGSIRGNSTRVLPDPIYIIAELIKGLTDDDDDNDDDAVIEALTEVAGNVPFVSLPASLLADSLGLDVGDIGRIPISGAIPNVKDIAEDMFNRDMTVGEKIKSIGGELADTVGASLLLPYGGSQIKKTVKGLSLYAEDLPGSYTDSGDLRYTVEEDVGSKVQAALFGAYANPYAQDYIDSGFKTIKKDNIDEMVGLDMNSTEYREYRKGLNKSTKTEDKLNYINSLDLTDSQKTLAANNLNKDSKTKINMSEYGNYGSYDEYKYARDYPEKYSVVTQITDYDSFETYKKDIADIKEQYSTTDERKAAVQSYIESLDLSIAQKAMVYKMAGGYSIKNYQNYVYEYIESLLISKEEKYTIWEELFN